MTIQRKLFRNDICLPSLKGACSEPQTHPVTFFLFKKYMAILVPQVES